MSTVTKRAKRVPRRDPQDNSENPRKCVHVSFTLPRAMIAVIDDDVRKNGGTPTRGSAFGRSEILRSILAKHYGLSEYLEVLPKGRPKDSAS